MKNFTIYLQEKRFTTNTINSYLKGLCLIKGLVERQGLELYDMEYPDVLEYIKRRQSMNVGVRTINTDLKLFRHYFNYLIHIGLKATNPAGNVMLKGAKKNHLYEILKVEQLEVMYTSIPDTNEIQIRNKVIVGLLVFQGLTRGELAKIKLPDIDLESCNVTISEQARSNRRCLPLQSKQLLPLLKYLEQYRQLLNPKKAVESNKLIISSGEGDQVNGLLHILQNQLRKKHSFFSSWRQLRASVICSSLTPENLRQQQHYFGFKYVSSIEEYLQHNVEDLREELDRYFVL